MNVVALIATRFKTDVCSAYLLEPDRSNLVLAATLGLHPRSIGKLRMPLSEGLAGLVAEQVLPVAVVDAKHHPRFKYFKESGEEEYHSFLGVPLIDGGILQGVLIVQTKAPRRFTENEVRMFVEAASQVAPVVSEARTLDRFIAPAQERLWALARNVWWSWDHDCISLFRDLNPTRWRQLNQNPISLLSEIPLGEIERRATELVLHSRINYVYRRQQEYLNADRTWGATNAGVLRSRPVAYFSAEFGLHESLPIYSGGLGVLSGDHIKSASDLDIPLIGIGLFYGQGYFLQRLDENGWQREEYLQTDVNRLPMQPAIGENGEPVVVEIATRGAAIRAKVWQVKVGRIDLLLLDSNVAGNAPEDLETTSRLYGGDARTRIRQELLLGVGGFRALKAMGISPGVLHLNEGHSGFAVFEAIRNRMVEEGIDFNKAARGAGAFARCADELWARESIEPWGAILHDRVGAEAGAARECGFIAARRGVASDVELSVSGKIGRCSADWAYHQRGACALVAGAADVPALRQAPWCGMAEQQRIRQDLGRD